LRYYLEKGVIMVRIFSSFHRLIHWAEGLPNHSTLCDSYGWWVTRLPKHAGAVCYSCA